MPAMRGSNFTKPSRRSSGTPSKGSISPQASGRSTVPNYWRQKVITFKYSIQKFRRRNYVFAPDDQVIVWWTFFVAVLVIQMALLDPLSFAVGEWRDHGILGPEYGNFVTVMFLLDIGLNFNIGTNVVKDKREEVVFDRHQISKNYLKKWFLS